MTAITFEILSVADDIESYRDCVLNAECAPDIVPAIRKRVKREHIPQYDFFNALDKSPLQLNLI